MVVGDGAVGFEVGEEAVTAPNVIAGDGAGGIGFGEGAFEAVGVVDHEIVRHRTIDAADAGAGGIVEIFDIR